ncbi:hypothetical protein ACOBQX_14155 [Actinokineospora sp. G85]|uniref:hypothetical protein n=1 Tax=Actinokineospora sp. G85 TaxID=3406626 RepID=UPI003C72522B
MPSQVATTVVLSVHDDTPIAFEQYPDDHISLQLGHGCEEVELVCTRRGLEHFVQAARAALEGRVRP